MTAISNPLDRRDCVLVDGGKVSRINANQFDTFRKSTYLALYELNNPSTVPTLTEESVIKRMSKWYDRLRLHDAKTKLRSLEKLRHKQDLWEKAINKSKKPEEARGALLQIVRENLVDFSVIEAGDIYLSLIHI